jgi:1-acyl-sn-glycerol-3-phosphate acyltransferase
MTHFINWIRSLVFAAAMIVITGMLCFALLWGLLLPHRAMLPIVLLWQRAIEVLERSIMGITYRVIGKEYIPVGSCIIASKHQSAWETFKLHILFGDPAIVLKKELLRIPLWGWFLGRSGSIPIDRAGGIEALKSMIDTARAAAAQGRKIVIFPQGTRIPPGQARPYKSGVAALYQDLNLPIVPMALNSGLRWPKTTLLKKPGLITIEFLPPIPPGLTRSEVMDRLKRELESTSDRLLQEATQKV